MAIAHALDIFQSPYTERVIILLLGFIFLGIGLASTGPQKHGRLGLGVLTVLVLILNVRYLICSMHGAIAFFVSLYDPFYLIGVPGSGGITDFFHAALGGERLQAVLKKTYTFATVDPAYKGLQQCFKTHKECSSISYYSYHPAWAARFYSRFIDANDGSEDLSMMRLILRVHIACNTLGLVLSFFQVCIIPRTSATFKQLHRWTGWVAVALTIVGSSAGLWMGMGHGNIDEYGGVWAVFGWISMFACSIGCMIPGVIAACRRDIATHEKWILRMYGAIWGQFLAFRLLFAIFGRITIFSQSAITLISTWGAAPVGLCASEWARRRWKIHMHNKES